MPAFILAQLLGAGAATALFRWLVPPAALSSAIVVHTTAADDAPGRQGYGVLF